MADPVDPASRSPKIVTIEVTIGRSRFGGTGADSPV